MKENTRPKGTHNFLSDLHYLLFLTSFEDVFKDFWVEFITRCKYFYSNTLSLASSYRAKHVFVFVEAMYLTGYIH